MRGAVVAEAMRRHRSDLEYRKKRNTQISARVLEEMIQPGEEFTEELVERLEKLDTIFQDAAGKKVFGLERLGMTDAEREEKQLRGMIGKIQERMDRLDSYTKLAGISVFFVLFVSFLFLLRDVGTSHAIESSVLYSVINKLPSDGSGSYFNSGTGATGVLSSEQDFYKFMSETVLSLAFTDPVCGDGICEEPTEYAGFGRFGCIQDCGRFTQTTTITINLPTFSGSSPGGWDISSIGRDPDPGYKYNIYSETMKDFLFATDIDNTTVSVAVPDGKLSLRFYQTKKVSLEVDDASLYDYFNIKPGTAPQRTAASDFAYGDPREFLVSTLGLVKDIGEYCEGIGFYSGDSGCAEVNLFDLAIKSMNGYGFSGTVSSQSSSRSSTTLATVPYCAVFPNGTLGVSDASNKAALVAVADTGCPANSLRVFKPSDNVVQSRGAPGELLRRRNAPAEPIHHAPTVQTRSTTQGSQATAVDLQTRLLMAHKKAHAGPVRSLLQDGPPQNDPTGQINNLIRESASSPVLIEIVEYSFDHGFLTPAGYDYPFWVYLHAKSNQVGENLVLRVAPGRMDNTANIVFPTCQDSDDASTPVTPDSRFIYHYNPSDLIPGNDFVLLTGILCNMTAQPPVQVGTMTIGPELDEMEEGPQLTGSIIYPSEMFNTASDFNDANSARLKTALLQSFDMNATSQSERVTIGSVQDTGRRLLGGVTVSFAAYARSNLQAGGWRNTLLDANTLQSNLINLGSVGSVEVVSDSVTVVVPGRRSLKLNRCDSHWDCLDSLFCANWDDEQDPGGPSTCWSCEHCVNDKDDAVDGICPQDKCPGSGGYPGCINGAKLMEGFSCNDTYHFEVWAYNTQGSHVDVAPEAVETVKTITPFNRIVGGIVVKQARTTLMNCSVDGVNAQVGRFTLNGEVKCPQPTVLDPSIYGFDPSFMSFSSLYNGKLRSQLFYRDNEMASSSTAGSIPYGFFPHSYDSATGETKPNTQIFEAEKDKFLQIFDQRLTAGQAKKMLTFMQDGKFIDEQTDEIIVQMVTYNAMHNMFALFTFSFDWQTSGNIKWDYHITSLDVDIIQSNSGLKLVLLVILSLFLIANCVMEIMDILKDIRSFNLLNYLTNPFNWLDWLHILVLGATIASVVDFFVLTKKFSMQKSYPILENTVADARMFKTVSQHEYDYLEFVREIEDLSNSIDTFFSLAGICVVLFIFRLLKSLDFQPRMGLVTRTIGAAVTDLLHFFFLFGLVFIGYACVGTLLFGHLFVGMSSVSSSCLTLIVFLLALDPTQFYAEMSHASSGLSFHLFLWSYVIVCFFILLNIFLAILVDAYARIKTEISDDYPGLPDEVLEVLTEAVKSLLPTEQHVSDKTLLAALRHMKKDKKAGTLREEVAKHLEYRKVVLLPGGIEVTDFEMLRYARAALREARGKPAVVAPEPSTGGGMAEEDDGSVPLDTLRNLMDRYAEDVRDKSDQRNKDILELVQMESLKRQLASFKAQTQMVQSQERLSSVLELLANRLVPADQILEHQHKLELARKGREDSHETFLHVRVIEAKGLPKMDLLRNCDPFCVLFLDRGEHAQMFTTDVKARQTCPVWNEDFDMEMDEKSTVLTCTVLDKDNVTKDDIMGVTHVHLKNLPLDAEVDKWYAITNAAMEKKLQNASVRLAVTKSHHRFVRPDPDQKESSKDSRDSIVEAADVVRGEPLLPADDDVTPLTSQQSAHLDDIREEPVSFEGSSKDVQESRKAAPSVELGKAEEGPTEGPGDQSVDELMNDLGFEEPNAGKQ